MQRYEEILEALRRLPAEGESEDHTDLSTNKYEHLGAAIAEHERG